MHCLTLLSTKKGGELGMEYIFSFILSVGASVVAYYICKWLDGKKKK